MLVGTLTFFGYDLAANLQLLDSSADVGLRLVWKFLMFNGVPLLQLTLAFGVAWLISVRKIRQPKDMELEVRPTN